STRSPPRNGVPPWESVGGPRGGSRTTPRLASLTTIVVQWSEHGWPAVSAQPMPTCQPCSLHYATVHSPPPHSRQPERFNGQPHRQKESPARHELDHRPLRAWGFAARQSGG